MIRLSSTHVALTYYRCLLDCGGNCEVIIECFWTWSSNMGWIV